jgi:hypothetical protein
MATKGRLRRDGGGTARKAEGRTSSASHGLVLRVIQRDQKCAWLEDFVQQIGEKFFGVERFTDLTPKQRVGWIRFNNAMARIARKVALGEADFPSLLRFLERIGSEDGSAELAEIEAEITTLAKGPAADDGRAISSDTLLAEVLQERKEEQLRRNAVHDQEMHDWELRRKVQLAWDCIVLAATVSCLVLAVLIILGVLGNEARMIGGTAVTGGIAVIGLLQVIAWGRWNPAPPGQFR